jgi:hypothetical protein
MNLRKLLNVPSFQCSCLHCFSVGHNSYKTLLLLNSLNTTFVSVPFSFSLFSVSHNLYNHILLTRLTRFSYCHLHFDALLPACISYWIPLPPPSFQYPSRSHCFAALSYIVFLLEQLLVIRHRAKPYLLEYFLFCNCLDFEQV